ncbi:bifunctional diguanylate cyclase/phosphodiesterase [Demequina sp. NBRC 110056]|uniref:putative bifunctional diguanylate cyclase/phosphodiesterase n=1 Tax=Demequina sp. NBRC 110056 TaxID=1570345 RepID=UPI0013565D4E|nr:EAL domain-containing protein [Demequina sp. NBRC 110056]
MTHDDELFRQTFSSSPIGMAIVDEQGLIVEANAPFAAILGYAVHEVAGAVAESLIHPDDAGRDAELREGLASGDLPYFQLQARVLHKSGDTVWTRSTVTRIGDPGAPFRCLVQMEDVSEVRKAKDLLERRAQFDHLTGLPNRSLLLERTQHALTRHETTDATMACLFLDLDHFKLVNDSLGHHAGDRMLVALAQRIRDAVRPVDTVSRLGGDEFVVILENIAGQSAAEGLLAVVMAAIQAPITVDGHRMAPTVSAGLAMAEDGMTAETLVRNADLAMSSAKRSGRNRVATFHPGLRDSALVRLSIETELRTAIHEGELVVHYQPVVELATRETVAFEALVRWQHPHRGLLLPQDFIEICEDANLVVPLGAFVIHEACRFIAANPVFEGKVLVNVSTRQIGGADLTRVVRGALDDTGVDPSRLGLEITESGMLLATQAASSDLEALASMGVDLILDDFGTGYSALSSVLQNPVAGLKLAREFTLRLGDRSTGDRISTAIANLSDSLGMYGVIEGVETEAQYRRAREHGWALGQGYLFGHPLPPEEITFTAPGVAHLTSLRHRGATTSA